MRTKYSVLNVIVGMGSQVLIALVGLVSRKVFIDSLGIQIQGINATLTSIITMLSLTELGIGTAIICNLYKPLADGDGRAIAALMQLYSKVYRVIALIVTVIGLCVTPFLPMLLNENDRDLLPTWLLFVLYGLFLADTVVSYLFAYKRSIIIADQHQYMVTTVYTIMTMLTHISQIILLLTTHRALGAYSFLLFLLVKVVCRLIENIVIAHIANRRYPYIRTREKLKVPADILAGIVANTKALALHYIGNYLVTNTATIVISHYLGAGQAGIYSNYLLVINTLVMVFTQVSAGVTASFGNLLATENAEQIYTAFRKAQFVVYLLANFCAISLFCLIPIFLSIWLPGEEQFSVWVVLILSVNFFITSFAEPMGGLRAAAGQFRPDRYVHLFLAALNVGLSILLVQVNWIGIFGVFFSVFLCRCIKELTVLPHICYRHILHQPFIRYEASMWRYLLTTLLAGGATYVVCRLVTVDQLLLTLLLRGVVCLIVSNGIALLLFRRTPEYQAFIALLRQFVRKLVPKKEEAA